MSAEQTSLDLDPPPVPDDVRAASRGVLVRLAEDLERLARRLQKNGGSAWHARGLIHAAREARARAAIL